MIVLLTISITMMAMAGGSALNTTVYQPFNNTAPSEYSGGGYILRTSAANAISPAVRMTDRQTHRPSANLGYYSPSHYLFGEWKMLIDGVLYIVRDDKIYDCRGVLVH